MSKKTTIPIIVAAFVGGVAILSTSLAHAQNNSGPWGGLVQMIAQKFNLDQSQVQSVFDQYRTQQKQNMAQVWQQREQTYLDQLVKSGKITGDQETAILNELTTLKNKYNPANFTNLTPDQRKARFQSEQDEINTWAKTNNIDPNYLRPGFGMRGMHRGFGRWNKPTVTPTPTP